MEIPASLYMRFSTPARKSDTLAAWEHCQPGYTSLLYFFRSGYLVCKLCGLKERHASTHTLLATRVGVPKTGQFIHPIPQWRSITESDTGPLAYLRLRGLTEQEILDYCCLDPECPRYVIFPILEDGEIVSWQGRNWVDDAKKYLSASTQRGWLPTTSTCWGLDRLVPGKEMHVCEGIFDAMLFPCGVAVLGPMVHPIQAVKVLDRLPSTVYLCADNDNTAARAGSWEKAFHDLHRTIPVRWCSPPAHCKDWGEILGERPECK